MTQNIYVGNLSYRTTEATLRTLFAEFGEVEQVKLITDRDTGRSKGFAFVEMTTEQAAQAAITALNGKTVDERELKVDRARPQADRSGGGGRDRRRPRW
jgi:RNA recognition motif-containing protein